MGICHPTTAKLASTLVLLLPHPQNIFPIQQFTIVSSKEKHLTLPYS